ncbi:MAG: hypothetical protein HYZ42_16960 [Bacteroidetes bacterium]|nr:hypothetical protein [Bacteroidota bacterium]
MHNSPTPKIGDLSLITITTPDLEKSLEYYQKLGFAEVLRSDFPFPLIQISDGAVLIMLRLDKVPYIALSYFVKKLSETVAELEQVGIIFTQKPKENDMIKRYLFQSPDGHTISLVTYVDGFTRPTGHTLLTMPQQDYFSPEKYTNKICGMFGEFAHPVKDLGESVEFWGKLGFVPISKFTTPYPWAIISDGLSIVGLHQTNDFSIPTITYFASDMGAKIDILKENGLTNFVEKGESNITLTTPEQQKINLFKLGM